MIFIKEQHKRNCLITGVAPAGSVSAAKGSVSALITAFALALILPLTSCYSWFETKVVYGQDIEQTTLGSFFAEEVAVEKLDTPAQVIVSKGLYSDTIKLTWQAVDYAKSYRIERAVVNEGDAAPEDESAYSRVRDYVYATSFEDKIVENPTATSDAYTKRYYYRICAENIGKGLSSSDFTDPTLQATDGLGYLLPPPSGVDAWKGKSRDTIRLSWSPVPNATGYIIYRGEKENGTGMEQVASVNPNKTFYDNSILTSEQGKEFFYKVQAEASSGSASVLSSIAMGYSLTEGAPQSPESVSVTNALGTGDKSLSVTWSKVENAEPESKTYTYSLYRTSSGDSVFTLIKNNISLETTSYTDTTAKAGVYYYYYVQTVAKNNTTEETEKSAFSETGPDPENPARGFILSAPSSVEVQDSNQKGKSLLVWKAALGFEIKGVSFTYKIYSSDTESGAFTELTTFDPAEHDMARKETLSLDVETKNFYKVSTVNTAYGTESASLSSAAAPMPVAPTNVTATRTEKIEGYMESANSLGVYPVKITWNAAPNAASYNIYRSVSPTESFRKINDSPVTETSFVDAYDGAKAGVYYYYKVISLNTLGQGNKGNDPATDGTSWGYGALTREQFLIEYNKTIASSQKKLTLMHKSANTDKLGTETINGNISGTLYYNAAIQGLGGYVTMLYTNYADHYINNDSSLGPYFVLDGNTNTTSKMDANGHMEKKNVAGKAGMYPGYVIYDYLEIKSGAAGGGYYVVSTQDKKGGTILPEANVDWTWGEK